MSFPNSPTDGQTATVNNIVYVYSAATNTWTRTASGFVTISSLGNISAGGNVAGNYIVGNGSQLTGVTATTINTSFSGSANTFYLDFVPADGANNQTIFNSPFLTYVPTTGILGASAVSATGNITGNYILGNGALLTGVSTSSSNINNGTSNVTIASANANITVSVGGTSNVTVFATSGQYVTGNIIPTASNTYTLGNATNTWQEVYVGPTSLYIGGNALSAVNGVLAFGGANVVTSTAPSGNISITGNVTGGNVTTTGTVSATGNITGGNILTAGLFSSTGNATHGNILTAGIVSATGNITGGNLSVTTGTVTLNNIVNGGSNATGNIGSSTTYFNTVFAKATSALYADLAEMYVADSDYAPGTLLDFGGEYEITATTGSHSPAVAGIVSTTPSYLMNSAQAGEHVLPVALTGRVPCQVVGTIRKGDRLVSSDIAGVATVLDIAKYTPGCIIGKSLEAYDSTEVGTIELVVGRD